MVVSTLLHPTLLVKDELPFVYDDSIRSDSSESIYEDTEVTSVLIEDEYVDVYNNIDSQTLVLDSGLNDNTIRAITIV